MSDLFGPLLAERELQSERVSLCFSLSTWATYMIGVSGVLVFFGVYRGWWTVALGLATAAVLVLVGLERRIDLDGSGLRFVPLIPIRPAQRFAFADIGPFAEKRPGRFSASTVRYARAPIESGRPYRLFGLFPRRFVDVGTAYGLSSYRASALGLPELLTLLERYRTAAPR